MINTFPSSQISKSRKKIKCRPHQNNHTNKKSLIPLDMLHWKLVSPRKIRSRGMPYWLRSNLKKSTLRRKKLRKDMKYKCPPRRASIFGLNAGSSSNKTQSS